VFFFPLSRFFLGEIKFPFWGVKQGKPTKIVECMFFTT